MLSLGSQLLVQLSLLEDVGVGDITTESTIPEDAQGSAILLSRESLVVCGHEIVSEVFQQVSERFGYVANYEQVKSEGELLKAEEIIGRAKGSLRAILIAERTALNFMQRLSGIATHTHRIVQKAPKKLTLLDTRKTTPGYRELEKHAVLVGGATNHRVGLYDQVLIKNNHIDACSGDVAEAIRRSRANVEKGIVIEVEDRNRKELEQALSANPDRILLDNMSTEEMKEACTFVRQSSNSGVILEASGGITEGRLEEIAATGVDAVSMGMLTHSAPSMDISLRFEAS